MTSQKSDINKSGGLLNKRAIEEILQTVYDPEFPYIDIFNMGLIYNIDIINNESINILMTLTSPACPAGDLIVGNIKDNIALHHEEVETNVIVTFDPARTPEMIKDDDLQKMFL